MKKKKIKKGESKSRNPSSAPASAMAIGARNANV